MKTKMKNQQHKLKIEIFIYMVLVLLIWFVLATVVSEFFMYLEDKRGIEFPFRFYITVDIVQAIFLILLNIPFLRFLIKYVDNPVQKIISGLKQVSVGNYSEKIDFSARNELDEIKDAFNEMTCKLGEAEKIKQNAENERVLLFANMAHDLKTPITSIIGISKALSDGIITDEAKKAEYIATINSKAVKMNGLIDRLFEYVKLESTENQLHLENADVAEVLRNCIADVYTEYEENNIQLEIDIPDVPVIKNADKLELSRVYTNLLNNVIKHNRAGIKVLVRMNEDGRAMIADSGAAVPQELAEKLFAPFVSGDASRRNGGGSGLGLSLAHKIMKKHGGDLRFVQGGGIFADGGAVSGEIPESYTKAFVASLKDYQ